LRVVAGRGELHPVFQRNEAQPLPAPHAAALRKHDAPEPAGKRFRPAELSELLPSCDESFLRGVLGESEVAKRAAGAGKCHVLKEPHKLAERLVPFGEGRAVGCSFNDEGASPVHAAASHTSSVR